MVAHQERTDPCACACAVGHHSAGAATFCLDLFPILPITTTTTTPSGRRETSRDCLYSRFSLLLSPVPSPFPSSLPTFFLPPLLSLSSPCSPPRDVSEGVSWSVDRSRFPLLFKPPSSSTALFFSLCDSPRRRPLAVPNHPRAAQSPNTQAHRALITPRLPSSLLPPLRLLYRRPGCW